MQKRKLEYALVFVVTLLLLLEVILANYKYSEITTQKIALSKKLALQQEIINHRNYVITALNALEIMLDNNASNQLMKVNEHLPNSLINYDSKISTVLLANYQNLNKLINNYLNDNQNDVQNKTNLLLQVTALKTELEGILQENYADNNITTNFYHAVLNDLEEVFKLILGLLTLTILNFYYFIKLMTKDHGFKLKHISDNNYTQTVIKDTYRQKIADKVVNIEHLCQKSNYFNATVKKQLQHQQDLIAQIQLDHLELNDIIEQQQSTDINLKSSFKLQARAVEINDKIAQNLDVLALESKTTSLEVQKNISNVKSIFNTSQKLSKVDSLELIAEDL